MERIYRVQANGGEPCCEKDTESVMEWIRNADMDDIIAITVIELPEGVYEQLPEFEGP